jgi:hypothetical protein
MKGNESLKIYYWDSSEAIGYAMSSEICASIGETYGSRSDLLKFHFSSESLDSLLSPFTPRNGEDGIRKIDTVNKDSGAGVTSPEEGQPVITINLIGDSLYIYSKAQSREKVYVLESSSNLNNWIPVQTYQGVDSIEYRLNEPANQLRGYYRIKVKSE